MSCGKHIQPIWETTGDLAAGKMVGKNTKTMYQLGDEVIVRVKNTDLMKKHLDFHLIGKHEKFYQSNNKQAIVTHPIFSEAQDCLADRH